MAQYGNYRNDPRVQEAQTRYDEGRRAIEDANDELVLLAREGTAVNKESMDVEARGHIGEATPDEVKEARRKAIEAEGRVREKEREIETREMALSLLQKKIREAETAARSEIARELEGNYKREVHRFTKAIEEAQVALNDLCELEMAYEINNLERPGIGFPVRNAAFALWLGTKSGSTLRAEEYVKEVDRAEVAGKLPYRDESKQQAIRAELV